MGIFSWLLWFRVRCSCWFVWRLRERIFWVTALSVGLILFFDVDNWCYLYLRSWRSDDWRSWEDWSLSLVVWRSNWFFNWLTNWDLDRCWYFWFSRGIKIVRFLLIINFLFVNLWNIWFLHFFSWRNWHNWFRNSFWYFCVSNGMSNNWRNWKYWWYIFMVWKWRRWKRFFFYWFRHLSFLNFLYFSLLGSCCISLCLLYPHPLKDWSRLPKEMFPVHWHQLRILSLLIPQYMLIKIIQTLTQVNNPLSLLFSNRLHRLDKLSIISSFCFLNVADQIHQTERCWIGFGANERR